jgi:hypothetical protein
MAYTPRPLQDIVGAVFREHQREEHITLTTLQQRWAGLVGPGLAERTWPSRLQKGLLWVTAPDSSWAYQLQFLKEELLGSLRAGLPHCPITELRFKVGTIPKAEAAPAPPGSFGTPVRPPSPAPMASPELARAAESISDPALRAAFVRALSKQAQRKGKREPD